MKTSPVIVALDLESSADARALAPSQGMLASYKVGLESYTSTGMDSLSAS